MNPSSPPSLVVGIGASAGGIAALAEFFAHAPAEAPIAYVVILHLSPDHDSRLAEVLQQSTSLPVRQIREPVPLEARHVYVIPPNRSLRVADGSFVLSQVTRFEDRKSPVDIFLRALAEAYGSRAAAVILSGTGPDGSNALRWIKEQGGLAIAQEPTEAEYPSMPENAIATGLVDFVLRTGDMPGRLAAYMAHVSPPPVDRPDAPRVAADPDALRDIMTLLRVRTRQDFSSYKTGTMQRRIERRMSLHGVGTMAEYAALMRQRPEEAALLMRELLISVTSFFRDPEVFAVLEERIVPRLFEHRTSTEHVRAWSAGCATGEEAYSLAMLLVEEAGRLPDPPHVQVFATDLDAQAIARAREGLYPEGDVADLSPERLQRFFQREAAGYRVRRELRELVLFATHNVIKDPPFSHLDLIACRNLLIYLTRPIQERVLETFHFALRPGRFLFLGNAESADGHGDLFVLADKTAHIYESRTVTTRLPPPYVERPVPALPARLARAAAEARPTDRISPGDLHLRLLEQFAPPSIVVTDDYTVVHMSENAGRYLRVGGGEPSRDVMALIRPELHADLRIALHRAATDRTAVEIKGVRYPAPSGDGQIALTLCVRPVLRDGEPPRGYFLILVDEHPAPAISPFAPTPLDSGDGSETRHLEEELARVKAQLRITVEQYETQVEEAKASNEELQAMNEELRSSAEELETSKEELQSVNEELSTVNQELKIKIEELGLTHDDFQNLINSSDIGAIFLDRSLRVKLSTPRAQQVFNLLPADVGRRLTDITTNLVGDFHADVNAVLEHLQVIEREMPARDGRWYFLRIVPYRTVDNRIDGVAITFLDVTGRHQAEGRVRAGEERLRLLIESAVDYAIFTLSADGTVDSWNPGAERMFGYRADEIVGRSSALLFVPEDRAADVPQQELARAAATGRADDERWHIRKNGTRFYASGVTTRLGEGAALGFAKIARDLTGQRETETALRESRARLEEHVQQRTAELQAEVREHAAAKAHVRTLLQKMVTAQETQRARIARDLHDQLGQQLTALRLALERHRERCSGPAEDLDRSLGVVRQLDDELDFLSWELRPAALDDLGLTLALPRFVEEWAAHYGIATHFTARGEIRGHLPPDAEVAFYRIAQEALNNVLKHAHASRVDVLLERRDGAIVLVVEDDGVGFDPADAATAEQGLGLVGMRERAVLVGGAIDVESSPGGGTTVYFRYPVAEGSPQA